MRAELANMSTEDFAAERKAILTRSDDRIHEAVRGSMIRRGLSRWEDQAVEAALGVFDETAKFEAGDWNPIIDDLRDMFEKQIRDALLKTKNTDDMARQVTTITKWLSTAAVNAGTEAAVASTPAGGGGLEWGTMEDGSVREGHKQAAGQTVPIGSTFEVMGQQLHYPGEPVGPPEVWINCRCIVRPTQTTFSVTAAGEAPGLKKDGTPPVCKYCSNPATQYVLHSEGMAFVPACDDHIEQAKQDAAKSVPGGEPDPGNIDRVGKYGLTFEATGGEPTKSAVIVALPAEGDWAAQASSEESGAHVTLLFLGDATFDPEPIKLILDQVASGVEVDVTEKVSGTAELGEDKAQVVLIDAATLADIRGAILATDEVRAVHDTVEQFPAWIPHLTLGYPDAPPKSDTRGDTIKFDRLALWYAEEHTEYPFGGEEMPETPVPQEQAIKADASPQAVAEEENDDAPMIPDEEAMVEVPWHGVLAPEGVWSGDRRRFAHGSLTNRDLPLPLKFMWEDDEAHKGSYPVARIERIFREDGLIKAEGHFDTTPAAYEAVRLRANNIMRGVSVDVDQAEMALDDQDEGVTFAKGRIASATICAIPAFAEAYFDLGLWADVEGEAPEVEEEIPEVSKLGQSVETFVSEEPWDGSASRFTPEQWHNSCILHTHTGAPTSKSQCKLPIKEPGGAINRAAVHAAAARFNQVDAPAEAKAKAKAALRSAYKAIGEEPAEKVKAQVYGLQTFKPIPRITKDGPGWITDPKPTTRITEYWVDGRGAAKIGWGAPGDFNRCRSQLIKYVQNPDWLAGLCANLHYRALRAWPGQAAGEVETMTDAKPAPAANLVASAAVKKLPVEAFTNPMLKQVTPFTVTDDGRVFGHIATWDVCHIGFENECKTAPHSLTDYAWFHTGEVETDAGPVGVGQITMGTGHAGDNDTIKAAVGHYDNTGFAVADVCAYEDDFGIAVAGMLRDDLTPDDIRALKAAAISGDWRRVIVGGQGGNLELVAALAVNVPGFPIPRASLTASAGHVTAVKALSIPHTGAGILDDDFRAKMAAYNEEQALLASAQKARSKVLTLAAQKAKARFTEGRK
jgi:hypothetical protein